MEFEVNKRCFKIDKHNAKAMLAGYPFNGNHFYQAIYCDVQEKPFPMLITLNKTKTNFTPSSLGESLVPDDYKIPLKFVAFLDSEYFIVNNIDLWKNFVIMDSLIFGNLNLLTEGFISLKNTRKILEYFY